MTAETEATAAAPDAHPGALDPHASETMPARARTQAAPAATLTQIRVLTTRTCEVGAYELDA